MSNDVVLSAALRSNLLSLQQTQKGIDLHQNRLSTGKKVNSALDNPQSYFASQSLTNRANDLSNLLDSIGQSIQVITAANNGVTALTSLVNQAQSIANSAQSSLSGASSSAGVTGNVNLGTGKLTSLTGITAGDNLTFTVTDPTVTTPLGAKALSSTVHANDLNTATVTITATDTAADLVSKINALNTGLPLVNGQPAPVLSASLDAGGHLVVNAANGGIVSINIDANGANNDTANLATAKALGFGNIAKLNLATAAGTVNTVDVTATTGTAISSTGLYSGAATLAVGSTLVSAVKDSANAALTNALAAGDQYYITVGGKTSSDLLHYNGSTALTTTVQGVVDAINHDGNISSYVSASFDTATGKISLTPRDGTATDVQFQLVSSTAAAKTLNLGFGTSTFVTGAAASDKATETVRFGAAAGDIANLQTQYNTTLSQITSLVKDTGYAGTNLLNSGNLTTYFNPDRSSSLNTVGSDFTATGLGLGTANFGSSALVGQAITQTNAALSTLRSFGSTLSNNLAIIQNRQDFTTGLINTLQTGSDALTNADQNEEGASLLALQTRQSLGITSLSLASQSQQAVLRLFG